jgi:hypothetical protein
MAKELKMDRLHGFAAATFCVLIALLAGCTWSGETSPSVEASGQPESTKITALEAGAQALQRDAPPGTLQIYLVGFHPMKDDPQHQFEAHHFCKQVNQDLMQCALYDGNTAAANLNGIEYIISERLFESLPAADRGDTGRGGEGRGGNQPARRDTPVNSRSDKSFF